ncbi:hypothetical protein ACEWY4_008792 [Coilia grayii]|uniref:Uncharacterized protein n=1 Tax=Coilia grayii TaxID=363190 RepID=A0ABD1KBT1_9TELE
MKWRYPMKVDHKGKKTQNVPSVYMSTAALWHPLVNYSSSQRAEISSQRRPVVDLLIDPPVIRLEAEDELSAGEGHPCSACLVTTTTTPTAGPQQDKPSDRNMQNPEAKLSRSSLLLSLKRYSAAVHTMEQTVLIPSLLREVPSDDVLEQETAEDAKDLYDCYLMLKAIRNTVDSGLGQPYDDTKVKVGHAGPRKGMEDLELDADPEVLLKFHLRGLFSVMVHLTKTSQSLTAKYMDIIGISN